jgi:heme oxygenase
MAAAAAHGGVCGRGVQGKGGIIAARGRRGRRYDEAAVSPSRKSPALPPEITDLPARLRLETRDLHVLSERSGVMSRLLRGQLDRSDYVALLHNLHALYAALESGLQRHQLMPALAVLGAPRLYREAALADDLDALCGPGWQTQPLADATRVYVQRLRALADGDPLLLAAHAYVRYLGDLNGGQMLKRLVAPSLAAVDGGSADALRFYDFGSEDEVLAQRQAFRDGLAHIAADRATVDRLVAEARWAFAQHVSLFNELVAPAPQPAGRLSA